MFPRLGLVWEVIFDFTTSKDHISHCNTERLMKCTMLQQNDSKDEQGVARMCARARTGVPPCSFLPADVGICLALTRKRKLCERKILRLNHVI